MPLPPLWISVLINIPVLRSRKTIPLIEISLWLFGTTSLSEQLGNPDGLFNFRGSESDWQSWRTLNELVGLCAQLRSRNEPCRPVYKLKEAADSAGLITNNYLDAVDEHDEHGEPISVAKWCRSDNCDIAIISYEQLDKLLDACDEEGTVRFALICDEFDTGAASFGGSTIQWPGSVGGVLFVITIGLFVITVFCPYSVRILSVFCCFDRIRYSVHQKGIHRIRTEYGVFCPPEYMVRILSVFCVFCDSVEYGQNTAKIRRAPCILFGPQNTVFWGRFLPPPTPKPENMQNPCIF